MNTDKFKEHISDETPAGERWRQSDDGWSNLWYCLRGNATAYRIEKDRAPMRTTTALEIFKNICKICHNKEGCKFYDLYR